MQQMPTVSIIIPVFNQWRYTDACLQALHDTSTDEIPLEVIIVDNGSTDESSEGLRAWQAKWSAIRVETSSENQGFSPGCNRGAQVSRAPYLVFLNNDTIPQPGWLRPLLDEIQRPEVGIAAPKLLYPNTLRINHAGYVLGQRGFLSIYHNREGSFEGANKMRDYQALLGACVIIKRDLFFSLGQFSLDGLEDIDLCLKVRGHSLRCRYVPRSVVHHHGSVTLTHSPPGSCPETTSTDFVERWKNQSLVLDDYLWHLEDEQWPGPPAHTKPERLERAVESVQILIEAKRLREQGLSSEALVLIDKAIHVWPLNPMAYVDRCAALCEAQRVDELLQDLQRSEQFLFYPTLMTELLPIFSKVLPAEIVDRLRASLDPRSL